MVLENKSKRVLYCFFVSAVNFRNARVNHVLILIFTYVFSLPVRLNTIYEDSANELRGNFTVRQASDKRLAKARYVLTGDG